MEEKIGLFIQGKSWRTQATYRSLYKGFRRFMLLHGLTLDSLTPFHLKLWVTSYRTANTQASAKRFLSAYFRFIGEQGLVSSLNATLKEVRSEFKFAVDLTPTEISRIIEACYDLRYKLAVSLMAYNGLRVGEVLGLYWSDVNVVEGIITFRRREGKYGPKGMRISDKPIQIPLNRLSSDLYMQYYGKQQEHAGRLLPISYKTFWKWFNRYVRASGVRRAEYHITPHKLRHAFAHTYLNNNGSIRKLQALLRHKKLETTTIYTKPSPEELRQEFNTVMAEALKS